MLEAETTREQRRPERSASTFETTPVKVKKHGHVVFTVSADKRQIWSKRFEQLERLERLEQWFYFDHSSICLVAC
jgi:hypothetical protein